jgi:hypothetical protein
MMPSAAYVVGCNERSLKDDIGKILSANLPLAGAIILFRESDPREYQKAGRRIPEQCCQLITDLIVYAGEEASREDCSELFRVFYREPRWRTARSMPCKQV